MKIFASTAEKAASKPQIANFEQVAVLAKSAKEPEISVKFRTQTPFSRFSS